MGDWASRTGWQWRDCVDEFSGRMGSDFALATQVQPDIRVLWVDHGYNREATYQHAEELKAKLNLNIQAFVPKYTTAYYDAVYGVPELTEENEEAIKAFSTAMKLEPFQRGMRDLAPTVWLTALRSAESESCGAGYL